MPASPACERLKHRIGSCWFWAHVDVEVWLGVVVVTRLQSNANPSPARRRRDHADVEVVGPASYLARARNVSGEIIEQCKPVGEPFRQFPKAFTLGCVEGLSVGDRMRRNLVVAFEGVAVGGGALRGDL